MLQGGGFVSFIINRKENSTGNSCLTDWKDVIPLGKMDFLLLSLENFRYFSNKNSYMTKNYFNKENRCNYIVTDCGSYGESWQHGFKELLSEDRPHASTG